MVETIRRVSGAGDLAVGVLRSPDFATPEKQ